MRIKEIQGLRALAVLLVIAFHGGFLSGGFIGVDVFYVISGYLITRLLLREMDETGSISLANFYSRRIKRLLPTAYLVLISTAIVSYVVMPSNARSNLGRDVVAAALYISNYIFAWAQNDYQNLGTTPSPILHFWSLAVEEQFYIIWPLLILMVARKGRSTRVFKLIGAVTLCSFALALFATSQFPIWSFYSLPTRAWELGLGALVVFLQRGPLALPRQRWIGWLALAAILIAAMIFNESTLFPGRAALLPTLGTAYLLLIVADLPTSLSRFFNLRLIQWIGDISYPLYLWHWPAFILPLYVFGASLTLPQKLGSIFLTFVLAGLTHRFVENPLRHIRKPLTSVVRVATIGTLVVSTLGVGISYSSARDLPLKSVVGNAALKAVTRLPAIYADGCQVGKSGTSSPPCVYGDPRGAKSIFLFGDSHAAQWFPTLNLIAAKRGFKLVVLTKSSCPSASVQLADQGAFRNAPCLLWRENSFKRIQAAHPWAVIVSNYDHYSPPRRVADRVLWWQRGVVATMSRLIDFTSHSIYIQDTPWPRKDIPSCLLQKKISACVVPKPAGATFLSRSNIAKSITVIDPTNWFCAQSCPVIIDGIVVYRDSSHMSVDFATYLDPSLTQELVLARVLSK